jgi:hypothetical protein
MARAFFTDEAKEDVGALVAEDEQVGLTKVPRRWS